MNEHTFYAGLDIRAAFPIDKRLYIDEITIANLQEIFGLTGQYGFPKAVIFNKTANALYYLSAYVTKADVINPALWLPVGSNSVEFVPYVSTQAYALGSCVSFTDSFNSLSFYIGLTNILATETPESAPTKWLNLSQSSSGGVTASYASVLHRLDPTDVLTQTLIVQIPDAIANSGTQYASVSLFGDFGVRTSGNINWEAISAKTAAYVEGGVMKVKIDFTGNFSTLLFDALDANQKNINIILK